MGYVIILYTSWAGGRAFRGIERLGGLADKGDKAEVDVRDIGLDEEVLRIHACHVVKGRGVLVARRAIFPMALAKPLVPSKSRARAGESLHKGPGAFGHGDPLADLGVSSLSTRPPGSPTQTHRGTMSI